MKSSKMSADLATRLNHVLRTVKVQFVTITPEMAAAWLQTSKGNRNKQHQAISRMVHHMKSGNWFINGEAIVFNSNGELVEGHHRLAACIAADTPFVSLVVTGIPVEEAHVFDIGGNRTSAQVAQINGIGFSTAVAGALVFLKTYSAESRVTEKVDQIEADDYYRLYGSTLEECATETHKAAPIVPHSMLTAWAFMAKTSPGMAEKYQVALNTLITGVPAYVGDPMHLFRERIMRARKQKHFNAHERLEFFYAMLDCWAKFVANETIASVRLRNALPTMKIKLPNFEFTRFAR